jgi:hypothetical protein
MQALLWSPYLPWALFAGLAALLFAAGHIRARQRQTAPARIPADEAKTMLQVNEAAAAVYEAAKREGMVIVTVAEGGADPIEWFMRSIATVVPVYRRSESGAFEKIDDAKSVGTPPQSLYIRKRNYQTYLGWARSMQ